MPRVYDVCNAKCPFFLSSGRKDVSCEGTVEESCIKLLFKSEGERNRWREKFCNTNYHKCAICEMLEKKYKD